MIPSFEVNEKVMSYINKNKNGEEDNKTDKLAKGLLSVPGLLRVGVNVLKWMDKHNLLPRSIIEASPFHTSLLRYPISQALEQTIFFIIHIISALRVCLLLSEIRARCRIATKR